MSLAPSAERFPELFPFHRVLDANLVIRQLGPALARLLGPGVCGAPLMEHARFRRPVLAECSLAGLARLSRKLFVLELLMLPLQLKGQLLVEEPYAFLLGTPVLHSLDQLSALGIRLSDIARHDALADAMVMLQTKDITISDRVLRRTSDLEQLATRDALTGLGNRLLFNRELDAVLEDHHSHGQPLALLLLDVDHFKHFNDEHGHVTGDACLRAVAQRLVQLVGRGGRRVYRYGGEEFAVLLPGADVAAATQLAERVVAGFATAALQLEINGEAIPLSPRITISAGLACSDRRAGIGAMADQERPLEATALISRADEALYEAKNAGRSRLVCVR
ncbi:diguanylate cyclase [Cyanobium sp. FGCU-6]|nr:diguanylate cyclase [Cyanobium sp. FGCU6]